MRHATGQVHDVAGADLEPVQRPEQVLDVLALDPLAVAARLDVRAQTYPQIGSRLPRRQHDPSLRLAKLRPQTLAREAPVGVRVYGQPLCGVEELDEDAGRRPETLDVPCAEPGLRVLLDRVAGATAVGKTR